MSLTRPVIVAEHGNPAPPPEFLGRGLPLTKNIGALGLSGGWTAPARPALKASQHTRAEVLNTVRRVADKLLHEPTVRVKELANETGAVSYAAALAELFALDPDAVEAVTRPEGLTP